MVDPAPADPQGVDLAFLLEMNQAGYERAELGWDRTHDRAQAWQTLLHQLPDHVAYRRGMAADATDTVLLLSDLENALILKRDADEERMPLDDHGRSVIPKAITECCAAEDSLVDSVRRLLPLAGRLPGVDPAIRRALASLLSTMRHDSPGIGTRERLLLARLELIRATTIARKAGDPDLAELLDAMAARLARLAALSDDRRPSAHRKPERRSLAPPGRRAPSHPLLSHAPPLARVSAAA